MDIAWIAGFIVGLMLVAIVTLVIRKMSGKPGKYDERQQVARGKAFTAGYATLAIYLAGWLCLSKLELLTFSGETMLMVGLLLSVAVVAGYSIFHDAYFRTSDRPKTWIIIFAGVTLLNLALGVDHWVQEATLQAKLGDNLNLLVAITTGVILVCVLIKQAMDRRNGEE